MGSADSSKPTSSDPPASGGLGRIASLDQFRGYTVVGMFLVNFLGAYFLSQAAQESLDVDRNIPLVLKHHNTYISYADTIMPQFFFAVGFAFRMTFVRRLQKEGWKSAANKTFRRCLALLLIGVVIYTGGPLAGSWKELSVPWEEGMSTLEYARAVAMKVGEELQGPLKRDWFQTLVHIGVTTIYCLPIMAGSVWTRSLFLVLSLVLHGFLSQWFYFLWVWGVPIGASVTEPYQSVPNGIDGGPLGFLTWTTPILIGSFAFDIMASKAKIGFRIVHLLFWGLVIGGLGWLLSCGTRLYDVEKVPRLAGEHRLAPSPVEPPLESVEQLRAELEKVDFQDLSKADLRPFLAEPPFVPPPDVVTETAGSERKLNYWMMSQRAGTPSYLIFASGLALVLYAIFVLLCDVLPLRVPIFRTFGSNALAAYVIHIVVDNAVKSGFPKDSPDWWVWTGFGLFMLITWLLVRGLEKNGIFIKL